MKREKLILGIVLFVLGFAGVLSLLSMDFKLPAEVAELVAEKFTPMQFKLVTLINPTVLLIVCIVGGLFLHEKAGLDVPVIKSIIRGERVQNIKSILLFGVVGGIVSGLLIELVKMVYMPVIPSEFTELSNSIKYTLAARFLYGGITEELLLRFGLMTLIVWLATKINKSKDDSNYWIGIGLSAVIFAFGHFPVVFQSVESPSMILLTYILLGNSIGGVAFGWLYWKKGLEAAVIAHIFAHVAMVFAGLL